MNKPGETVVRTADLVNLEILLGPQHLSIPQRITMLIAKYGGYPGSQTACWLSRATMAGILGVSESVVRKSLTGLRRAGKIEDAEPWVEPKSGREHPTGLRVLLTERMTNEQFAVMNASSRGVSYCRWEEVEAHKAGLQAKLDEDRVLPGIFFGNAACKLPHWRALRKLFTLPGIEDLTHGIGEAGSPSRTWWLSLAAHSARNPTFAGIEDDDCRVQVALLSVADHVMGKAEKGKWKAEKPAGLLCTIMATLKRDEIPTECRVPRTCLATARTSRTRCACE
jgi:hypothetical protein